MKIIRKKEIDVKQREDGREVCYYPPIDIAKGTEQIGLISVETPKGCREDLHEHPISTEIFFHLTPGAVSVNGEIHELEAGDIIILDPGDKHKQIADDDIKIIGLRIPLSSDKNIF